MYFLKTVCIFGISLWFIQNGFAQSKSYEDRLSQIGVEESNRSLGTMSGRDKGEMRQKDLIHAYTYFSGAETKAQEVKAESKAEPKRETFEGSYVEFRTEHKIPNYIGDDQAKQALKKTKDDSMKLEVVKIVEAEKILHDAFQTYHTEKAKTELEGTLLTAIGNKKDLGVAEYQKEMNSRMDVVGEKTAGILSTSIQKLSSAKLIEEREPKGELYMSSGGRVFPKLEIDEDKDFLNLRGHVMERVQKDLMVSMAGAINNFYHTEQKETSKAEIEKKEQLMAFVRVEDKENRHQDMKQERMEAIKGWIESAKAAPVHMVGERISLDPKTILELQGQIGILREQRSSPLELNKLYRTLERSGVIDPKKETLFRPGVDPGTLSTEERMQFFVDMDSWENSRTKAAAAGHSVMRFGGVSDPDRAKKTTELNQKYLKDEAQGIQSGSDSFRPGVDPNQLPAAERDSFFKEMKAWDTSHGRSWSSSGDQNSHGYQGSRGGADSFRSSSDPSQAASLNQLYKTQESSGQRSYTDSFRPGVDPGRLSEAEQKVFFQEMRSWESSVGRDSQYPTSSNGSGSPPSSCSGCCSSSCQ